MFAYLPAGSAPPSRAGSKADLSSYSGTLTAPSTPNTSPPVSPKRRGKLTHRNSRTLSPTKDNGS